RWPFVYAGTNPYAGANPRIRSTPLHHFQGRNRRRVAFGLPQFLTAEIAYLVATSTSWADPNCLFW
ncbi:hypothetical protein ACFYXS_03895, partial [Streptomyces sp. NPDC002574]|uniref:hypothetical protein n=1 Tax=Streptomyces sp. NPDC002574 TaxID=3364652 RepID=UPI0036BDC151